MSTQLFLRNIRPTTHLGTNSAKLNGSTSGWLGKGLRTTRNDGAADVSAATATVAGATSGVEVCDASATTTPLEWISEPVAADVTISGAITGNIWASENSMSANVAINFQVDVIRATDNSIVSIVKSARVTELNLTTRTANNFTATPGAGVTVNKGDRLRVRIFGDDAGTMASGFTFLISWDGNLVANDGDTYVTFTEDITFQQTPAGVDEIQGATLGFSGGQFAIQGDGGVSEQLAYEFTSPAGATTLQRVWVAMKKNSAPTDNLIIELQSDSSGAPSGTSLGTIATVSGASLTTSDVIYAYDCSIAISASTVYHIVLRRDGARDTTNYYTAPQKRADVSITSATAETRSSSSWTTSGNDGYWRAITDGTTCLFLTDTASDVATASVDREAWTSRGGGVANDVTNTAAGWTSAIQVTDTAGGTVVDWFTKQLTAFTLSDVALLILGCKFSAGSTRATIRVEIARVDSDGTNATVWGTSCKVPTYGSTFGTYDAGEISTTEDFHSVWISGDDLSVSDGQRLRIRLSIDDTENNPLVTGRTVTIYYAGATTNASGDSFLVLAQKVTEYVPPLSPPFGQQSRQRDRYGAYTR